MPSLITVGFDLTIFQSNSCMANIIHSTILATVIDGQHDCKKINRTKTCLLLVSTRVLTAKNNIYISLFVVLQSTSGPE